MRLGRGCRELEVSRDTNNDLWFVDDRNANHKACVYVNTSVPRSCQTLRILSRNILLRIFNINKNGLKRKYNVILFIYENSFHFYLFTARKYREITLNIYLPRLFHTSYLQDFWTSRKITYLFAERIYFKFIFSRWRLYLWNSLENTKEQIFLFERKKNFFKIRKIIKIEKQLYFK